MSDPVWSIAPTAPASIASAGLRPKTDTLPLSGTLRPSSMSSVVDLPAPLGPSSATVCPAGIDTSTARTAWTRPPGAGNDLARPLSSMLRSLEGVADMPTGCQPKPGPSSSLVTISLRVRSYVPMHCHRGDNGALGVRQLDL